MSVCVCADMSELRAAGTSVESNPVIPLLLQNKPPVVEGREKDDLADIALRPDQVDCTSVWFS